MSLPGVWVWGQLYGVAKFSAQEIRRSAQMGFVIVSEDWVAVAAVW